MAEFYSSLSKDLTMLLTDTSDYNMIITVGEEPDVKKYHVHSNILRVRSKYFSKAVSADWARKENGIILFSKPNIESDVFDIILRFIYGGKINFTDKMSSSKIFDCLKAADELCLDEFLDYAQTCLLGRKDWLKENLFLLYRDTFPPSSLTKLQEYCINQIRKYPLKLFISPEFITLPKVCLEELVQDDLLEISELQLFEKLIEWGIANTEDLTQTNINKFSEKDCASLSLTLDKLLKHIRFYHMESNDFYLRVTPLKAVLGTNFYDEMEVYHNKSTTTSTNGTSIPKPKKFINLLPNRGAIISKIMNLQQGAIISSWIDRKDIGQTDNVYYTTENNPYNFKLLLRGSKDGFSSSTFHSKVKKCRSTVTLFKLKNHDDFFIGGYNPDEWDAPYWPKFKHNGNAFLFSFSSDGSTNNNNQRDEIQPENVITDKQGRIARIKKDEEKFALNLWRSTGPSFGKFDILMQTGGIRLKHNSYVPNVIPLQDGENYKIEEYEVFEVTQKVDDSGGEKDRETNDVVVEIHE
ncbi:hypothetical protein RhiirA5_496828 [Rhizophagus irregularis]|uniref:Kelch-like protein 17 n=6 Tax=Rhizophagus irregularis TaxID=588596 RepID=A0A2N0Q0I1_9GLOM|nr:hypothetical protein RhiirA5_496828 [Rhizophagus irregularis]PKC76374.1 hypothetical protein RhiirA1_528003 [Rhizophagus irregularis]GBC25414.2 BTB/POZ protein [Rhizophagus irregularis DAOM 181602=DAOM 197198]CAB4392506.1 unnamed protein product [Rhizophagus irregularis]